MQVPLVASNRIGKEIIETEHGKSEITFYGNSFIAGNLTEQISFLAQKYTLLAYQCTDGKLFIENMLYFFQHSYQPLTNLILLYTIAPFLFIL